MKWELLNGFENKDTHLSDDMVLTLVRKFTEQEIYRVSSSSGSSHWCAGTKK